MIYFTTFIFTLLLSHIACALPGCGDAAPPEDLYEPTYDDVQEPLFTNYPVEWDKKYDGGNHDTKNLSCAHRYPHYKNIPHYPYIGGASFIRPGPSCSRCWKLHNKKTNKTVSVSVVDHASPPGFKVSKKVYDDLGGKPGKKMEVEGNMVPRSVCGFT